MRGGQFAESTSEAEYIRNSISIPTSLNKTLQLLTEMFLTASEPRAHDISEIFEYEIPGDSDSEPT